MHTYHVYIYIYICKNLSDLGSKTIRVHEERIGRMKKKKSKERRGRGRRRKKEKREKDDLSSLTSTGVRVGQDMFALRNRTRRDSLDAALSDAYSGIGGVRLETSGGTSDVLVGDRSGGDGNRLWQRRGDRGVRWRGGAADSGYNGDDTRDGVGGCGSSCPSSIPGGGCGCGCGCCCCCCGGVRNCSCGGCGGRPHA